MLTLSVVVPTCGRPDLLDRCLAALARQTLLRRGLEAFAKAVRPAPCGVSVRQQRKVVFDALLFKKHRRLYRERIRAGPRWDYYAIVGSLAAGATGFTPALAVWVVLTAGLCMRRLRGASRAPSHVAEMVVTSLAIPPVALFWRIVGAVKYRVAFL
jgi:hypothetical protein